jgi:hypothetical protein
MAYTPPVQATAIEGLQIDASGGQQPAPNPTVGAGRQLCFAGQTANASAGAAANQALGAFSVPAGTANGGAVAVPNALVGPGSYVFLQPTGNGGAITGLAVTATAAGQFTATIYSSGATTSATDVWYAIFN